MSIEEMQGLAPNYPMIGDTDLEVSKLYGMLPAAVAGGSEGRTAADNQTVRTVFVIAPDKTIKLTIAYPMTTGRNFDELLRVIDSLQLTAAHKVATPVNWEPGEDVIIVGSVSDDEAKKLYPNGWRAAAVHPVRAAARAGVEVSSWLRMFGVGAPKDLRNLRNLNQCGTAFAVPRHPGGQGSVQQRRVVSIESR